MKTKYLKAKQVKAFFNTSQKRTSKDFVPALDRELEKLLTAIVVKSKGKTLTVEDIALAGA
jgi:hypothetical protein